IGQRVQGRVGEVGRAPRLDPGVREAGEVLAQDLRQAGLADARLAHDQYHLAFAFARLLEALAQEAALVLAADEGREPSCRCGGETAAYTAWSDDAVERHGLLDALEHLRRAHLDDE